MYIRKAELADLRAVEKLSDRFPKELGRVFRGDLMESLERGTLLVAELEETGQIVGYANYYPRRDGWNTLSSIAVFLPREGIGRALVSQIPRPIRLRCPPGNQTAELFYRRLGFVHKGTVLSRSRLLNIWELTDQPTSTSQGVTHD